MAQNRARRTQRGNVLFLILLAVVLFAALANAVTSSMRGDGNNADRESLKGQSSDIMQFLGLIDNAVMRMQISNSLRPENISFGYDMPRHNGTFVRYGENSSCSTTSCQVFHADGGGLGVKDMSPYGVEAPTSWNPLWEKPGYFTFMMMQWPGSATSANDLVIRLAAIKPPLCQEINANLGISSIPTISGTYIPGATPSNWDNSAYTISANAEQLYGKDTFSTALYGSGSGQYCHIYHVVIKR